MEMTRERFDALVAELETKAAADFSAYKLRVLLLAILGYAYIFFVLAAIVGYLASHVTVVADGGLSLQFTPLSDGGMLALFALAGMALVGFLDDWIKYTNK